MNKTLLLIIVDFLFLNLIALTRWEKAEPARPHQQPVPSSVSANIPTPDQDLVESMRQSLVDEQAVQRQLERKLSQNSENLSAGQARISQIEAERGRLAANLEETRRSASELEREVAAARESSDLSRQQVAELQRELAEKLAETERQRRRIEGLEQETAKASKQIQGLTMAVVVGEAEKQNLQKRATELQDEVAAERADRIKVEENTTRLATDVGRMAETSGDLTREIRENRPVNINVLYNDYLSNRVETTLSGAHPGFFGTTTKSKETPTVFTTDGRRVYALLHIQDTIFSFQNPPDNVDWSRLSVVFTRPPDYRSEAGALLFLNSDPRVVVVPVGAGQVAALAAKVYPLAKDPFKFPTAVLVSGRKGYGEVPFKLDPSQPGYVRVENRFFKRLFGDFAPSRGDLVFSHTGELLGIMVNNDYCAVLKDFTPAETIPTGDNLSSAHIAERLNAIAERIAALPSGLQ